MNREPIVSICIPNYNYARFLPECLDSVLHQTFRDFEVIFRDNASTDNSYSIAGKYQKIFMEQEIPFYLECNAYNYGSDRNSELCAEMSRGKYRLILASDDILYPNYLEEMVGVLERYPHVSMVMAHRDEIDGSGEVTVTKPFYKYSCVIPGEQQAAVFMKAGIAIPGQRVMRVSAIEKVKEWICTFQVANDWYYNALMSCVGDIAYLKDPLMQYRIHDENETTESEDNMTAIMEHYQIIHKIAKVTAQYGYRLPAERLSEAIDKLGDMCLRYAFKMAVSEKYDIAMKYLNQARVFKENMANNELFGKIEEAVKKKDKTGIDKLLSEKDPVLARQISYDIPEGAVII